MKKSRDWVQDGLHSFGAVYVADSTFTRVGADAQHVEAIKNAVKAANEEISKIAETYRNNSIESLRGFYAEAHHAGTFNINAAKAGIDGETAIRLAENTKGSPDIGTSWGQDYGLKYRSDPINSLGRQAEAVKGEPGTSVYDGQGRVIPSDQLSEARKAAEAKINKLQDSGDTANTARYEETNRNLADRIESPSGVKSDPLSKSDADRWAADAKEGNVRLHTTDTQIDWQGHAKHIGSTAATAAAISVAIQAAPVVLDGMQRLYGDPEYGMRDFGKQLGTWMKDEGGSVATDAFTKAALGGCLAAAQKAGQLTGPLANASSTTLAGVAVVAVESAKAMWAWQNGEMTGEQAASQAFSAGLRTSAALAGQIAGQALIPIPVVGALVGAMVASWLVNKGTDSMNNPLTVKFIEQIDRTFEMQKDILLATFGTTVYYRDAAITYDRMLVTNGLLLEDANSVMESGTVAAASINDAVEKAEHGVKSLKNTMQLFGGSGGQ